MQKADTERRRRMERVEDRLTDSDCGHHWRHDDGECHSTSNHQVPLVVGDIFAFITVMDLREERGEGQCESKQDGQKQRSSRIQATTDFMFVQRAGTSHNMSVDRISLPATVKYSKIQLLESNTATMKNLETNKAEDTG